MSGHSKWHSIKHKKGALDAKRGKIFTRIIKELTVAARIGGGDPAMNPRLRTIVAEAKRRTCPTTTSRERSVAARVRNRASATRKSPTRATAPAAPAVIVETVTDNRNRTVGEIRHMFGKHGGNLGAENSVAWMFERKGYIVIEKAKADEETLMAAALDAGADDLRDDGDNWEVICGAGRLRRRVRGGEGKLGRAGSAAIAMLPKNREARRQDRAADGAADGSARRPRRRPEGVVELRHRGKGDRGLTGVRIFGIDPGSLRTGFGCVDSDGSRHRLVACGAIHKAPARAAFPDRLHHIHGALVEIARRLPARLRRHRIPVPRQ